MDTYQDDIWVLTTDGNYTCADCDTEVTPNETYGNREYSEPRCLDCYETNRYNR